MSISQLPQPCPLLASAEFAGVDLGDKRRNRRLLTSMEKLALDPSQSYPKAMPDKADLEGWYRFLENEKVTAEALLSPHVKQTWARCVDRKVVLAVQDSTAFHFGGEDTRRDLGHVSHAGKGHGFLCHPTVAVAADGSREMLGVIGNRVWTRRPEDGPTQPQVDRKFRSARAGVSARKSEQDRWWAAVADAERDCPEDVSLIHIADREGDAKALIVKMIEAKARFVLRLCHDRRLAAEVMGIEPAVRLEQHLRGQAAICTRTVNLSARGRKGPGNRRRTHPARREREAQLSFSAAPVTFETSYPKNSGLPPHVSINVVHVWEAAPVGDEPAVEWFLLTSEPIDTVENVLAVVDFYRARWTIEEFFMAVKTGCSFQERQLESLATLTKALAVTLPLAWMLMRLRTVARQTPDAPAVTVLTGLQLRVLKLHCSVDLPKLAILKSETAGNAMAAVARLGGHITRNGEPGWRTLAAGFFKLLTLVRGYELARQDLEMAM